MLLLLRRFNSMSDTQQRIIEAAIVVLNDDLSASLDKIAGQAGVTRRTLHRYFEDRQDLYASCRREMQQSCQRAMSDAYASTATPWQQLERLLYAGIDCGTKYAFLHKLTLPQPDPDSAGLAKSAEAIESNQPLRRVLRTLQHQGALSPELTLAWLEMFFFGMIQATMHAAVAGTVAQRDLKPMAWCSFSQGIGLRRELLAVPA